MDREIVKEVIKEIGRQALTFVMVICAMIGSLVLVMAALFTGIHLLMLWKDYPVNPNIPTHMRYGAFSLTAGLVVVGLVVWIRSAYDSAHDRVRRRRFLDEIETK